MDSRLGLCSGPCLFKSEYILLTAGPFSFWEKKEETSKWRLHSGSLWNSLWETVFSSWQFPEFIFGFYYTLCKQGLILLSHSLSTWLSIFPPKLFFFLPFPGMPGLPQAPVSAPTPSSQPLCSLPLAVLFRSQKSPSLHFCVDSYRPQAVTFILLLLTSLQFPEALEQQQQLRMQLCRKPRAFTTQEVRSHFILYRYFNIFKKSSMLVCSHLFSSLWQ